ncbi:MAG: XRE family transcriptional regulator [Anaerolineae bacterium]|nr:MAG: XRE family transcriptional regulator [Anaerolineae bacterium]
MAEQTRPLSKAAEGLKAALSADSELAKRLEARGVHRTMLWRFCTGRRKPSVETAALLERETKGEAPASGWENPEAPASGWENPDAQENGNADGGAAA